MGKRASTICLTGAISVLFALSASAADPRWTVPSGFELPATPDGGHFVEGTATAPPWAWHGDLTLSWARDLGLADSAHQTTADLRFGIGMPLDLEIALGLPVIWTVGSKGEADPDTGERSLAGMGEDGFGVGDLRLALMWCAMSSENGGFGLLFGVKGGMPTGNHERLMGEGGYSAEPFVSAAFQVFSTRLSLNLAYRFRPEHVAPVEHGGFEQDDDVIWRVALRVPRKNDVAWSVEVGGQVGVLTDEGPWPSRNYRALWFAGGLDFPLDRLHRMALFAGFGPSGEAVPDVLLGMRVTWSPVLQDEDGDGLGGADQCPLIAEDMDGFEDGDGCPDLDNDGDGVPDDEDRCPLKKAGSFSDDGC